jgi:hypothetical protein
MNISSFSEVFIPLLKTNKLISIERNYESHLFSLYDDLLEADKNVNIHSEQSSSLNITDLNTTSTFFPKQIRTYIKNTSSSLLEFHSKVHGREIQIKFYQFPDTLIKPNKLRNYVKIMLTWLTICAKYSHKKCAEDMIIHIYLTPFKKILPTNKTTVLGAEHVNTAFTMSCAPDGEIIIFREEEWFKVFLHESFHAYGLDFGMRNSSTLHRMLFKIFPIKIDFNENEAYAETWARIINVILYSFFSLKNKDNNHRETFLLYTDFGLQLERLFSIFQMNKVLNFMGLNYDDLYDLRENRSYLRQQLYKENTHVFGYYILTAIFLNDYKQFIGWCQSNNVKNNKDISEHIIQFNCHDKSFQKIGEYINSIYNNEDFLKTISAVKNIKINQKNNILHNTTRMALLSI